MKPYYEDDYVTLYHAKCEDVEYQWSFADVMVSDVPYGVAYNSGARRDTLAKSIAGDLDTSMRDYAITEYRRRHGIDAPMLIFGSPKVKKPRNTRQTLVWDTKGALGMGALDIPWKPAHQEIYVLGKGFHGKRSTDVLVHAPVQSMSRNGRLHPHQKPLSLMQDLIEKCPPGVVADPFAGSGSTLVASKALGRRSVGVELDEAYCEMAALRCQQEVLDVFGGAA